MVAITMLDSGPRGLGKRAGQTLSASCEELREAGCASSGRPAAPVPSFGACVMLLEQDSFLNQLIKLFDRSRTNGSVFITMKRYTGTLGRKSRKALAAAEKESGEVPESKVLVRAVAGKAKISTLVSAKDHTRFSTSLMNISKVKMDSLKKREKPPKNKTSKA